MRHEHQECIHGNLTCLHEVCEGSATSYLPLPVIHIVPQRGLCINYIIEPREYCFSNIFFQLLCQNVLLQCWIVSYSLLLLVQARFNKVVSIIQVDQLLTGSI